MDYFHYFLQKPLDTATGSAYNTIVRQGDSKSHNLNDLAKGSTLELFRTHYLRN